MSKDIMSKCYKVIIAGALGLSVLASTNPASANNASDAKVEARVEQLLAKMTLTEKIGQMGLRFWPFYNSPKNLEKAKQDIRAGKVGGYLMFTFNFAYPNAHDELQKVAIEESPNGIPLIFGHDVIHGYKTIFPIPLGQAATWNPKLVEEAARVAAIEASSAGVRWNFSPMIDIPRDPRWGRIAESLGEDVHLASELAQAMVKGYQGKSLSSRNSLAACPKHFAGYGAAEGGRDFNASFIPEGVFRDTHLPPFKAAISAGAPTIMTSYTEVNGIPATADKQLLSGILRGEWGFDGFVVSDWASVTEMVAHGFARDNRHAAELAVNAGLDFEMTTNTYQTYLADLIKEKKVSMKTIDDSVRRMLRIKIRMGLFEKPYTDKRRAKKTLSKGFLKKARIAAQQSMVLLKNADGLLPVNKKQTVALIGPLAQAPRDQLGSWSIDGNPEDSITPLTALSEYIGDARVNYAPGLSSSVSTDTDLFAAAIEAAKKSDVILFVGGEAASLSGEGRTRGDISLPGVQQELLHRLAELNKPIALVILAGRPISLQGILPKASAVMMAWHPGTMAGPALVDVLYGKVSPSGRLPISWPKSSGQIPIHYDHKNTSRPANKNYYRSINDLEPRMPPPGVEIDPDNVNYEAFIGMAVGFTSSYLDYGYTPEFPFGFGLGYTTFEYSDMKLKSAKLGLGDSVEVSILVKNTGKTTSDEVVQLYVNDIVGSLTRPVRQLKAFKRITLRPGRTKKVKFSLAVSELGFHNQEMKYVVEPGRFNLWVARNAADNTNHASFVVE